MDVEGRPQTKRAQPAYKPVLLATLAIALFLAGIPWLQHYAAGKREDRLRAVLAVLRDTIRQHHEARGTWPASLQSLVTAHYLREIPKDPMTDRNDGWEVTSTVANGISGVIDVRSGSEASDRHGTPYSSW